MRIGIKQYGAAAAAGAVMVGAMLAGCEPSPLGRRQSTALQSPTAGPSAEREVQAQGSGVPLITIEGPRDKNDTIHVMPLDSNVDLMPATSTAPASRPAPVEEPQMPNGTIDLVPKGTPPAGK